MQQEWQRPLPPSSPSAQHGTCGGDGQLPGSWGGLEAGEAAGRPLGACGWHSFLWRSGGGQRIRGKAT
jgi:hypothetical protein